MELGQRVRMARYEDSCTVFQPVSVVHKSDNQNTRASWAQGWRLSKRKCWLRHISAGHLDTKTSRRLACHLKTQTSDFRYRSMNLDIYEDDSTFGAKASTTILSRKARFQSKARNEISSAQPSASHHYGLNREWPIAANA